jgi:hypothetical protein
VVGGVMGNCCECNAKTKRMILGVFVCSKCCGYDYCEFAKVSSTINIEEMCKNCAFFNRIDRFDYLICKECDRKRVCEKLDDEFSRKLEENSES